MDPSEERHHGREGVEVFGSAMYCIGWPPDERAEPSSIRYPGLVANIAISDLGLVVDGAAIGESLFHMARKGYAQADWLNDQSHGMSEAARHFGQEQRSVRSRTSYCTM